MRSLLKVTLLAASVMACWSASPLLAAEKAQSDAPKAGFTSVDQQTAYALGAQFGRYMGHSFKEQEELGVHLDRKDWLTGLEDGLANKSKLSDEEIADTLQSLESRLRDAAQQKIDKLSHENAQKGEAFRAQFAKEKGVQKTPSGLLYQVENPGNGSSPADSDTVVVNYSGKLIDGTQFDSSYDRHEPLTIRLDRIIPGWQEGLKKIKKGGKIKLVIPPDLAYGESGTPGIPPNSTLVFEVELLDIKPQTPASAPPANTSAPDNKASDETK